MSQEEEELKELESLLSGHFGRTPANSQEIHEETSKDRDEQSDFSLEEECEVVIGGRARSHLSSVDQDSDKCSSDVEYDS